MLINYTDSTGNVFIDTELCVIRIFFYDQQCEWSRDHMSDDSPQPGNIVSGTLTNSEASKVTGLAKELGVHCHKSPPTEIHGFGMRTLTVSDTTTVSECRWNEGESLAPSLQNISAYLRRLRSMGKDRV